MKIVATSDTHFPFDDRLIPDGDVFLHGGDLMSSGYEREWYSRVESLKNLPHKTKIYVPGNHDFHVQNYTGPANQDLRAAGVHLLGTHSHYFTHELENGMVVLGLPFVTGLESWAFNRSEDDLERLVDCLPDADIVLSHSPPSGILDKTNGGYHVGVLAWYKYLMTRSPKIWICGHIHESYGHRNVRGTDFYNVAMCNRQYEQANPAVVIEV